MILFGPGGWFAPFFQQRGIQVIFALPSMVLVTIFICIPFTIREVVPVLEEIGPRRGGCLPDAGRLRRGTPSSGSRCRTSGGRWRLASLLTTARAIGEIGAVLIVSGSAGQDGDRDAVSSYRAYEDRQTPEAYVVALVLASVSVALFLRSSSSGIMKNGKGPAHEHPHRRRRTVSTLRFVRRSRPTSRSRRRAGAVTALLGPFGVGQEHGAADDRRLEEPDGRPHLHGRRGAHRQERAGAPGRVRVPALRAVPPYDGAARTWSSVCGCASKPTRQAAHPRGGSARAGAHGPVRGSLSRSALRRPAATGGAGARAGARSPSVLLLDEPFGALDAKVRQDLRRWLHELHRELGVTSLLVTHDQEEAMELANQIVVMHEGRVEQVGLAGRDLRRPRHAVRRRLRRLGERAARRGDRRARPPRLDAIPAPRTWTRARPRPLRASTRCDGQPRWGRRHGRGRAGRLARVAGPVSLRLPGGETLVAHVPKEDLHGAGEGDEVQVDLRNPKAFLAPAPEIEVEEVAP